MKRYVLVLVSLLLLLACNEPDLPVTAFQNADTSSAYLRTVGFQSAAFVKDDAESQFQVSLDFFDNELGQNLDKVAVFISFKDYTPENGNLTAQEIIFDELTLAEFNRDFDLPRVELSYSLSEVATALSLSINDISCSDEFLLRLEIILKDGSSISVGQNSINVIFFESAINSQFRYRIPVIEPIDDNQFTGEYLFRSVSGHMFPIDFELGLIPSEFLVEVEATHTPNFRRVQMGNTLVEFRILCDEIRVTEYLSSCYQCDLALAPPLLGPTSINATVNPLDDSAIEIKMDLGYEGVGGFAIQPTVIQLIKQ